MHLLFLNQYGPGDASPTAKLLRDLVEVFEADGHCVTVAAVADDYRQKPARGWRRWVREFAGLGRLFGRAIMAKKPDVVISFSSPPGVVFIAALVARWHRARSIHWVLDLYPDIALVLGEVRSVALAKLVDTLMSWAYRRTDQVVTLDADMQERLQRKGVNAVIIPPWLPLKQERVIELVLPPAPCWIYSGNLGRAHEWKTLLEIQERIEKVDADVELIFQGGGAAWPEAQAYARELGLQRCRWRDYAAEESLPESLLQGSVLVATQRPDTQGMLWPSKLALLRQLPRPILWVGPVDSAAARMVAEHPYGALAVAPGEVDRAVEWLLKVVYEVDSDPFTLRPDREEGLGAWQKLVEHVS